LRGPAEHDDALEVGQLLVAEGIDVVRAEEVAHRAEPACAAPAQEVAGLGRLVAGVERHQHAAGRLQPERRDLPFPQVRRPDRDAIAGLEARRDERTRRAFPRRRELCEAEAYALVVERERASEALRSPPQRARELYLLPGIEPH